MQAPAAMVSFSLGKFAYTGDDAEGGIAELHEYSSERGLGLQGQLQPPQSYLAVLRLLSEIDLCSGANIRTKRAPTAL